MLTLLLLGVFPSHVLHVQITHTHSLTLQAKEERAGDLPRTRTHIHCARAITEHSLSSGRGWVAGSKRGKQEDKDTDLGNVQKGPKYFMHF